MVYRRGYPVRHVGYPVRPVIVARPGTAYVAHSPYYHYGWYYPTYRPVVFGGYVPMYAVYSGSVVLLIILIISIIICCRFCCQPTPVVATAHLEEPVVVYDDPYYPQQPPQYYAYPEQQYQYGAGYQYGYQQPQYGYQPQQYSVPIQQSQPLAQPATVATAKLPKGSPTKPPSAEAVKKLDKK